MKKMTETQTTKTRTRTNKGGSTKTVFVGPRTPEQKPSTEMEETLRKLIEENARLRERQAHAEMHKKALAKDKPKDAPMPKPEPATVCFECDEPSTKLTWVPEGFFVCPKCLAERRPKDRVPSQPKSTAPKTPKEMPPCLCGCGETTKGGKYRPGHDARHHAALKKAGEAVTLLSGKVIPPSEPKPTKKSKALNPNALWKACEQAAA